MPKTDDDWFSAARRMNEVLERRRRASPLSSAWGRRRSDAGKIGRDKECAVFELLRIRDAVRNIIRVHGVGKHCRIDLADIGQTGAGLSGFEDAPRGFERPFIFLDKRVYETCAADEIRDVYCGIGLHEAGHVLYTREFFRRATPKKGQLRVWENLWEDERIEEIVREASPGFAPYLQSAKRGLLEHGELGEALSGWDDLPDMDRLQVLIFAFIRGPHLIESNQQTWTVIDGECPFETLREMFPAGPADETDVEQFAVRLNELWERIRKLYDGQPPTDDAAVRARWQQQRQADDEDKALEEAILEAAIRLEEEGRPEDAMRLLENWTRLAESEWDELFDPRHGRRFGLPDAQRLLGRTATVSRPLDDRESKILSRLERERITAGDEWTWGGDRETVITHPVADDKDVEKFAAARSAVRGHVSAMKSVFRFRLGTKTWHESQRRDGQLHRRMLGRAMTSDRIFRHAHEATVQGIALCVLLDESGSMDHCVEPWQVNSLTKAATALRVAVLIAESLRSVPGVELEIYSYTSTGDRDQDCLVRYLYGRNNTNIDSIGAYGLGANNYDHQSILTAARLFEENTRNKNRLMLVVSDGYPQGTGYAGEPAIRATRDAVQTVRRQGIGVVNVAIENYRSEAIYGDRHVVKFTNLDSLITDMRGLITRIIRKSTESG